MANIQLTSLGSSMGSRYDVTLAAGPDIAALIGWLKQIDWTPARAHDLSNVGLAHVGRIVVRKKDGTEQSFGLSGGSLVSGRWGWDANTDELATIARQSGADVHPR